MLPSKMQNMFSSVNSALAEDGSNIICEIHHVNYEELEDKYLEAKNKIDTEGFVIIRGAIDQSIINAAHNDLSMILA